MTTMTKSIPYERQEDRRKCGAAALNMVYRSFGRPSTQTEIWPRISADKWSARTHLLAKDAMDRGLAAAVLEVRSLETAIARSNEGEITAILNHRLNPQSRQGHFSVLVGRSNRNVILHDPFYGPSRLVSPEDLASLWNWKIGDPEVSGNILVALTENPHPIAPCRSCGHSIPESVACPNCTAPIPMAVAASLGCGNRRCTERAWRRVFCPACDYDIHGFADGEPYVCEKSMKQTTMIAAIVDLLESRARYLLGHAPDESLRSTLQSIVSYCPILKNELESDCQSMLSALRETQMKLDRLDDDIRESAAAAVQRQELRRAARRRSKTPNDEANV